MRKVNGFGMFKFYSSNFVFKIDKKMKATLPNFFDAF